MSKLSDDDLTRIINVDFEQYREIAIKIAREELERRMKLDESTEATSGFFRLNSSDEELIAASGHLPEYADEEPITASEHLPEHADEELITASEYLPEYVKEFDEQTRAVNGDYLVTPFIGKIKSGFFSPGNAETVSRQLQSLINQYSQQGWEFHSIARVDIEVTPGCLASLFGARTSYITFDQVVFRRASR